jgi:multiple sugar transport system substrate-binding protein
VGIPFAIYPSALYYQAEMFDEAGLNYPPHQLGEKYVWPDGAEAEWDYDTLRQLALLLTVDANGQDATSPDFDPQAIQQYGYEWQWPDLRGIGSAFGSGSLVADDGLTAQLPPDWVDAWSWTYQGMWTDHFIPTDPVRATDEFGQDAVFSSARAAMAINHLWLTCCLEDAGTSWDVAVVPSHNGSITAPFNADSFRLLQGASHPEQAFEVLTFLQGPGAPRLLEIYGAMPARSADQPAFFAGMDEQFPQGVDWQVFSAMTAYPDIPSFEGYMPNYNEAFDLLNTYQSIWESTPDLVMDQELDRFLTELQSVFDKAQ